MHILVLNMVQRFIFWKVSSLHWQLLYLFFESVDTINIFCVFLCMLYVIIYYIIFFLNFIVKLYTLTCVMKNKQFIIIKKICIY